MYCKKCGKELPQDSNFCPFCGTGVSTDNSYYKYSIPDIVLKNKKYFITYGIWIVINVFLWALSSPIKIKYINSNIGKYVDLEYTNNNHRRIEKDLSDGFYPFDKSIADILDGKTFHFSLSENIDVYDFSEFFFYTIIIPIFIWMFIKVKPYFFPFWKHITDKIICFNRILCSIITKNTSSNRKTKLLISNHQNSFYNDNESKKEKEKDSETENMYDNVEKNKNKDGQYGCFVTAILAVAMILLTPVFFSSYKTIPAFPRTLIYIVVGTIVGLVIRFSRKK